MLKKTMSLVLLAFLVVSTARAGSFEPMPITGFVTSNFGRIDGLTVKVTNLETDEFMTTETHDNGGWLVEWANSEFGARDGDEFKIEVLECVSGCSKTIVWERVSNPLEVNVNIDLTCPEDTSPYSECDSCCPEDNTPYADCDSCCGECPDVTCPDCPENDCSYQEEAIDELTTKLEECESSKPETAFDWLLGFVCVALGIPVGGATLFYFNKKTHRWKKVTDKRVKSGTVKKEANA